jgi:RNA polymerase-associated protein CTR9
MLAIIELNESKKVEDGIVQQENSLKQGLQHMQQAHVTDRRHPAILNTMANHFFLTRDFEKVLFILFCNIVILTFYH